MDAIATYYGNKDNYHGYDESLFVGSFVTTYRPDVEYTYTFENFFHPYVQQLIARLNKKSLDGLLDPVFHAGLDAAFFTTYYSALTESQQVSFAPFPRKNIDLAEGGPYAGYNWELFFHFPLTIAVHLSKNQRFAEAQRWFHHIFDPTSTDTSVEPPGRFWKFLRFRQESEVHQMDQVLALLSKPDGECTDEELALKPMVLAGYQAIIDHPFEPHRVARTRIIAYQYSVVMRYLDNLIAWGDSLFAQDTVESINEATQRYVTAANLLGPRPQAIPPRGTVAPRSYHDLKAAELEAGNAMVELEGKFPFNIGIPTTGGSGAGPLFGIGDTLYFCTPRNERIIAYWDTVEDRLRKIRNCMNISGVVRPLALFDPPIDPGMLVKAAAAGIDIGSIVSGLNQPVGPLRAQALLQRAQELCGEVKSLGGALLSAIEKRDAEGLSLLRQGHELAVQQLSQDVRYLQWKQAEEATEGLLRTRAGTLQRYDFALRMLGAARDANAVPDTFALGERTPITEESFDEVYAQLVGQFDLPVALREHGPLRLAAQRSPAADSGAVGTGPLYLTLNEDADLNVHGPAARKIRDDSMKADMIAAILALIPDMGIDLHFWGMGGHANIFGGTTLATAARFYSGIKNLEAATQDYKGATASKTASFERRADEWIQQGNVAARELMQIGRQLIGSLIAEQVARQEYESTKRQIENTQAVGAFMQEKFSNEALYGWMQGELSRLYYEYYRFAFDVARRAERTMKRELMRPEVNATDYVKFNYWDGGRRGLLSGEALSLDLKRMELAYHDNNQREFELTRHVSLRQLDPAALLMLRVTGSCTFAIPEAYFDLECAGHYMRRLRSVAVSIPSVVGPYTGLHATLTLLGSSVRVSPLLSEGAYVRAPDQDDRFVDYLGSVQQVVTSGGLNDSGLFETNLRDERPLPFEGAGAVGTWRIDLPTRFSGIDRETVSDVVLHLRYTARQGGALLGEQALFELGERLKDPATAGLTLLSSLRHDFAGDWSAFATGSQNLDLTLRKDHFPSMAQGFEVVLDRIELAAKQDKKLVRRAVLKADTDQTALTALSSALNGDDREAALSIAPDDTVLTRSTTATVFLLVRYHLDE